MRVIFTKKKMTLDETIKHAKEKAKEQGDCSCGTDHKQLAEWLEELKSFQKRFWESGRSNKKGISEKDVDPKELKRGVEVEYEHTTDKEIARRIALDHLSEVRNYYQLLDKMENSSEAIKE